MLLIRGLAFALAVGAALAPRPSIAFDEMSTLVQVCKDAEPDSHEAGVCLGYVRGVVEAIGYLCVSSHLENFLGTGLTLEQRQGIAAVTYFPEHQDYETLLGDLLELPESNPQYREGPAVAIISIALQKQFPCSSPK